MMYLFTTPSCPYCPQAKKLIESKKLPAVFIDVSKPEGLFLARKYRLAAVPSIVVTNQREDQVTRFSGIEEITANLNHLYP